MYLARFYHFLLFQKKPAVYCFEVKFNFDRFYNSHQKPQNLSI